MIMDHPKMLWHFTTRQ